MRNLEQELPLLGNGQHSGAPYAPLPCLPEAELDTPILAGGESYEWAAIANLDTFFSRIYRYWHDKGPTAILVSGVLNILALAFTVGFSGFLLLFVNWQALHDECIKKDTCDIVAVAVYSRPLQHRSTFSNLLVLTYLAIFGLYWLWTLMHFITDLRDVVELRHFVRNKLGISERQVTMMTWAEVVHRIVLVQRTTRLCIARDLNEHDIISRIMRKDNYLIGMLNRGVLKLNVPIKGLHRRMMLTKTLEWNLRWCVLDHMFDERFEVKKAFLERPEALRKRLQWMALANLLLSPFLFAFIMLYFFMKNAEKFYHHPGSLGSRRWSSLAKWRMQEFNELPHYINHRYVCQFPSHTVTHVARFTSFVTGSFTALLLLMTMLDETLLERPLLGRHLVWWLATLGVILTASRTFISDDPVAYDPEGALAEVAVITHYLPRHWRGRAHSGEVQAQFQAMFQLKVLQFLEETASILLTPFVLYFSLPACAGDILQFVHDFTVRVDGVGDICSLAAFDLPRHGNSKYGAPTHSSKDVRSKQGKLEKSFLTFVATYPTWDPLPAGKAMLSTLCRHSQLNSAASLPAAAAMSSYGQTGAWGGPAPYPHVYESASSVWLPKRCTAQAGAGSAAMYGHASPAQQQQQQQQRQMMAMHAQHHQNAQLQRELGVCGRWMPPPAEAPAEREESSQPHQQPPLAPELADRGYARPGPTHQHGQQQPGKPVLCATPDADVHCHPLESVTLASASELLQQQIEGQQRQQWQQGSGSWQAFLGRSGNEACVGSGPLSWERGAEPAGQSGSSNTRSLDKDGHEPLTSISESGLPCGYVQVYKGRPTYQFHLEPGHSLHQHAASRGSTAIQSASGDSSLLLPSPAGWLSVGCNDSGNAAKPAATADHPALTLPPGSMHQGVHGAGSPPTFTVQAGANGRPCPHAGDDVVEDVQVMRSSVFGFEAGGGSDALPTNEEEALGRRIAIGHSVLQSYYEGRDHTVQHRMQNQLHSRMSVRQQSTLLPGGTGMARSSPSHPGLCYAAGSGSRVSGRDSGQVPFTDSVV